MATVIAVAVAGVVVAGVVVASVVAGMVVLRVVLSVAPTAPLVQPRVVRLFENVHVRHQVLVQVFALDEHLAAHGAHIRLVAGGASDEGEEEQQAPAEHLANFFCCIAASKCLDWNQHLNNPVS